MTKISVVIPTYNGSETIAKCLNSVLNQTLSNLQIIVVNDGSTDDTGEILDKYKNRINIINQENKGATIARNTGGDQAYGEYIIFCDDDIEMNKDMLQKMYEAITAHPEVSYVYSSFIFGHKQFSLWPFSADKLKKMPYIHTTSLIRKDHWPRFDENLTRFQDWDLWLTMLEAGHIGHFIPEVLFTVKAGGSMSTWLPKIFYKLPFLSEVKKYKKAEKDIKVKHNLL